MQREWAQLRIDEKRLREDFEAIRQIGKVGKTGINRPAFSPEHLAARGWLRNKIEHASLEFRKDGAGNHSGTLHCGPAGAPILMLGSHLDSVPKGGMFDGVLGVLAGLEILRTIKQAGIRLPVNLEVIDFTDEEGTFVSFLGSFAFAGLLERKNLANPRGDPQGFKEGLKRAGLSEESILTARRDPKTLACYLELHVEQGPQLNETGNQIGVVTNIAGISFYRITFHGRAEHAGTIPMEDRRDAALGSSAFTLSLRNLILEKFPDCFANIGKVHYEPGAFNIVPEKAVMSMEFRAAEADRFRALEESILHQAERDASRFGLGLDIEHLGKRDPVEMNPIVQKAIHGAAKELGLRTMHMVSRAGHDAQPLATLCPTGMIFIPSVSGISHSPEEFSDWQDCVNGANVLLQAALRLATDTENNKEDHLY